MTSPTAMQRLQSALDAVAPTVGVAVKNGAVARIDFTQEATSAQRAAAQGVADRFDWSAEADAAFLDAKEPALTDLRDQVTADLADLDRYLTRAKPATDDDLRAEVLAIDGRQRRILRALARIVERPT